jgi:Fic family protein
MNNQPRDHVVRSNGSKTPLRQTVQWPAIGYENQTWVATPRASYGPAATRHNRLETTYESAVPENIAHLTPQLDSETLTEAEAATVELSRFDAELGTRVSAFAPVLLRSEAASSSQIENLTASARSVLTAELGAKTGANAMLIAANTNAMRSAIELADALSPNGIRELHGVLMASQPLHTPGQWRTEPVWIGTSGESPHGATFVAPAMDRVPNLIEDLVRFSTRDDIPALVQVAIAHAQFETIHPFSDGNGRTGRALAQSMLRRRGVTRNVAVPVSAGLLGNIPKYHDALTAFREGDVAPIVRAFSEASERAVVNARRLVTDIDNIRNSWTSTVRARSDSGVWPLLDLVARRPVLDAVTIGRELGISNTNAYPLLKTLSEQGILRKKSEHESGVFWRNDEVLNAIDQFAARAGRRFGN